MTRTLFAAAAAFALAVSPMATPAANANPTDASAVYKQTLPGIACVIGETRGGASQGTGWVVDKANKLLVTNFHVVERCKNLVVFFPETKDGKLVAEVEWYKRNAKPIEARVVATAPKHDLAVIQVDSLPEAVKELKLAGDSPEPGSVIHTVGNPGSSQALWVYTNSNVRAVYRYRVDGVDARVVETSLAIDPGASGSPVVNAAGEVVAVIFAYNPKGRLVTLSVDVSEVKLVLEDARLEAKGEGRKTPKADDDTDLPKTTRKPRILDDNN